MDLMKIPGKSGEETAILSEIKSRIRKAGVSSTYIQTDVAHKKNPYLKGQAGNLIVHLPGTISATGRILSAHMDTVPVCLGSKPVIKGKYVISSNPQTGAGADDRSGCAIILYALLEIIRKKLPHPPLTFLWTIQEEVGLFGSRFIDIKKIQKPAIGFNFDGGMGITIGATGSYHLDIDVLGCSSHAGSKPREGISSIAIAGLAIADLQKNGWLGAVKKGKEYGTANVGIIKGGDATNVVTPWVNIKAEARSHNPIFRKRMISQIKQAFEKAAKSVKNNKGQPGKINFKSRLEYESFLLKKSEPAVLAALRAAKRSGANSELKVSNGGLDANWLHIHGIPTVTLSTGVEGAHSPKDCVNIPVFQKMVQTALEIATDTEK